AGGKSVAAGNVERGRLVEGAGGRRRAGPHGQERGRLVQGGGAQLRRLPSAQRGAETGPERGAPLYRNVRRRRRPGRRRPVGTGRRQRTLATRFVRFAGGGADGEDTDAVGAG